MKIRWFLMSLVGFLCLAAPAKAGNLSSWRFNLGQNRLEFATDEDVQPRAQLIANPTRLVIDLPGTSARQLSSGARSQTNQTGARIRQIRIGQLDADTTRIVIELAPGYTIDPQQVQFRGLSPTQWTVQLPTPQIDPQANSQAEPQPEPQAELPSEQRSEQPSEQRSERQRNSATLPSAPFSPGISSPGISSPTPNSPSLTASAPTDSSVTQIEEIQVTADGLFVRTRGAAPEIKTDRRRDRQSRRRSRTIDFTLKHAAVSSQLAQTIGINRYGISQLELSPAPESSIKLTLTVVANSPTWQASASGLGGLVLLPEGGTVAAAELVIPPSERSNAPSVSPSSVGSSVAAVPSAASPSSIAIPSTARPPTLSLPVPRPAPSNFPPIPTSRPPISGNDPNASIPLPSNFQTGRVTVVLDPGHGGNDPGAIGIDSLHEADIVLPIAQQVAAALEQQGVQALLTRNDDREVELEPRVQLAERANATLFVSIHANSISLDRPDVNGFETYYYSNGQALAQTIYSTTLQTLGIPGRGMHQARFYVLRRTTMPSTLIEIGFVTGSEDEPRLANPEFRSQLAAAIAQGILQYLQRLPNAK